MLCNEILNLLKRVHGGCDRSTGDAYSSMVPYLTTGTCIFRGQCAPILWFVYPIGLMRLNTVRYFCHFVESNQSKDWSMHEGNNPSFWDEFTRFTFFLKVTYNRC
jgi:hypothetical protein